MKNNEYIILGEPNKRIKISQTMECFLDKSWHYSSWRNEVPSWRVKISVSLHAYASKSVMKLNIMANFIWLFALQDAAVQRLKQQQKEMHRAESEKLAFKQRIEELEQQVTKLSQVDMFHLLVNWCLLRSWAGFVVIVLAPCLRSKVYLPLRCVWAWSIVCSSQ